MKAYTNIFEAFKTAAEKYPDRTAVIYLGTRFTYKTILKLAENFAGNLLKKGVEPGERIILYIPNSVHWVVCWLGIQRAGAIVVPITPIYTQHDLVYIANDSGARHIVCSDTNFGYVKQAIPETNLQKSIAVKLTDLLPPFKKLFGWAFDKVPKGKVANEDDTLWFKSMVRENTQSLPPVTGKDQDTAELTVPHELKAVDMGRRNMVFICSNHCERPCKHQKKDEMRIEDLEDCHLMTFDRNTTSRRLLDGLLREKNIKLDIFFESENVNILKQMVLRGMGGALVPEYSIGSDNEGERLRVKPLKENRLSFPLRLYYNKNLFLSRAHQEFLTLFTQTYGTGKKKSDK